MKPKEKEEDGGRRGTGQEAERQDMRESEKRGKEEV